MKRYLGLDLQTIVGKKDLSGLISNDCQKLHALVI